MKHNFLEGGQIVNTHGIRGEVKIVSWCDTPEYLADFSTYYIDQKPVKVRSARVHKGNVIASLEGYDDINAAMLLKNKIVHLSREDAVLPEGQFFLADLIGLKVFDADNGEELGILEDVLTPSVQKVYVIRGQREIMVPAVDEFLVETNIEEGYMKIHLIEGM